MRKIIAMMMVIVYALLSQFALKAYATTPPKADMTEQACIVSQLDNLDDQRDCWEQKYGAASQINAIIREDSLSEVMIDLATNQYMCFKTLSCYIPLTLLKDPPDDTRRMTHVAIKSITELLL